jgi:hypothetical protein
LLNRPRHYSIGCINAESALTEIAFSMPRRSWQNFVWTLRPFLVLARLYQ